MRWRTGSTSIKRAGRAASAMLTRLRARRVRSRRAPWCWVAARWKRRACCCCQISPTPAARWAKTSSSIWMSARRPISLNSSSSIVKRATASAALTSSSPGSVISARTRSVISRAVSRSSLRRGSGCGPTRTRRRGWHRRLAHRHPLVRLFPSERAARFRARLPDRAFRAPAHAAR